MKIQVTLERESNFRSISMTFAAVRQSGADGPARDLVSGPTPGRRPKKAGSPQVEPIRVHHLAPGGNEVVDEQGFVALAGVYFGQRPQL